MQVIVATNDPVRLSFLLALLRDAGIEAVTLDQHISAVEGNIAAFARRIAVANDVADRARRILRDAGEL